MHDTFYNPPVLTKQQEIQKYKELLSEKWVSVVLKETSCLFINEYGIPKIITDANIKTYECMAEGYPRMFEWCRVQAMKREIPFNS